MSAATVPPYADLEPRQRRRLLGRTALSAAVTPAALLALYYTLPLDHPLSGAHALWFLVGFLVFAAAVAWYSIIRSPHPRLRAIEALAAVVPVFVLMFAGTYFLLAAARPGSFSEPLSRTDTLYFTVTVFATVGFGDITPKTGTSRILLTIQMIGDLVLVGLVAKLLVGAVQIGLKRLPPQATSKKD